MFCWRFCRFNFAVSTKYLLAIILNVFDYTGNFFTSYMKKCKSKSFLQIDLCSLKKSVNKYSIRITHYCNKFTVVFWLMTGCGSARKWEWLWGVFMQGGDIVLLLHMFQEYSLAEFIIVHYISTLIILQFAHGITDLQMPSLSEEVCNFFFSHS